MLDLCSADERRDIAISAAARATALAAAEVEAQDLTETLATITACTTAPMIVEWYMGGCSEFHADRFHADSDFAEGTIEETSPKEKTSKRPVTSRLSTVGYDARPLTNPTTSRDCADFGANNVVASGNLSPRTHQRHAINLLRGRVVL